MSAKKNRRETFERQDLDKPFRKGWGNRRRSAERRRPIIKEIQIGEAEFFEQLTRRDWSSAHGQTD